ncbi:MAG: 4Fe-4S dicluster domain-containing protein [Ignavibacteriales bacterium]|nr:4Fe-4S dicluster domain-containing protein [Ignavibacteriales bacterium]
MIVSVSDFYSFLNQLTEQKIFDEIILPAKPFDQASEKTFFTFFSEGKAFELDSFRTVEPAKILFYPPRERVLPSYQTSKKRLIIGIKACDLSALLLLDEALLNSGFVDPCYSYWRNNTTIISSDCMNSGPNCLCLLLDGKPYPEKGFDLNISRIDNNYLFEVNSNKGNEFVKLMELFVSISEETPTELSALNIQRQHCIEELSKKIELQFKPEVREQTSLKNSDVWLSESGNCVNCGACTNICPTCYCLILNDESKENNFIKVRSYDSCQLHGYARVAGGGTPRPRAYQRFKNRVLCKFSYMKSNFKMFGCTGCGRCIEACGPESTFMKLGKTVKEGVVV